MSFLALLKTPIFLLIFLGIYSTCLSQVNLSSIMEIFLQFLTNFKSFYWLSYLRAKEYKLYSEFRYLSQKKRCGEPKLKNPCADLNGAYLGS